MDIVACMVFATVKGPSHFIDVFLKICTLSPVYMRYFVAGGSLELRGFLIRFSGTIRSISVRSVFRAPKRFVWFMELVGEHGKRGGKQRKLGKEQGSLVP